MRRSKITIMVSPLRELSSAINSNKNMRSLSTQTLRRPFTAKTSHRKHRKQFIQEFPEENIDKFLIF